MIATLFLIWVLRNMCLGRLSMPWLLPVLFSSTLAFLLLFVSLPQYILFLYTNPLVADPSARFDYIVSMKKMPAVEDIDDEELEL